MRTILLAVLRGLDDSPATVGYLPTTGDTFGAAGSLAERDRDPYVGDPEVR